MNNQLWLPALSLLFLPLLMVLSVLLVRMDPGLEIAAAANSDAII